MKLSGIALAICMSVGLAFGPCLMGCGEGADDGMTAAQREKSAKLGEIAQRTGGDWEKASQQDRDFLIEYSRGSEASARKLLMTMAGQSPVAGVTPGNPPTQTTR